MKTRVITAVIALPVLFFILLQGGIYIYIGGFILSIIGQYEFYKAFSKEYHPLNAIGYVMTILWYLGLYYKMPSDYSTFILAGFLFVLLGISVFSNKSKPIISAMVTFVGFFYVAFTLSHIVMISGLDDHFFIWYPFIIAFVTDTFAYLVGKMMGSKPLIKRVSPNKTIEGAIGGIIACVIVSYAYAYFLKPDFTLYAIFLGLVGSPLSQLGDLIASKIKRQFNVKDFGKILPGHGGVLDRFDSLIVTMPLVYYFMVIYQFIH